jgi:hypothetical protein
MVKGENGSLTLYLRGRGPFIARVGAYRLWSNYFTKGVKLRYQWGPKLIISVRRGWTGLPGYSSWFSGAEVDDARVDS